MVKKEQVKDFLKEFFQLTKVKFYFFALVFVVLQIIPHGYVCSLFCTRYYGFPFKLPIILIYDATSQLDSATILYLLGTGLFSFIANALAVYLTVVVFAYIVKKIDNKYIKTKINRTLSSPNAPIQKNNASLPISPSKYQNQNKKPEVLKPRYSLKSVLR